MLSCTLKDFLVGLVCSEYKVTFVVFCFFLSCGAQLRGWTCTMMDFDAENAVFILKVKQVFQLHKQKGLLSADQLK